MSRRFSRTCLAVALVAAASGCAGPAIEGVLADQPFAIQAGAPKRLGTDTDPIFVFFEADDDTATLRTVAVTLPAFASLPRDEAIAVDGTSAAVEVIEGVLERLDGDLVSSTDERTTAQGNGGEIVLDGTAGADGFAGEFRVDLDDGGYVAGRFASSP